MIESIEEQKEVEPRAASNTKEPEDRVSWGILLKYLLLTIVGVFLLMVFVDKVAMPWYVKLGAVENVPNVVGMTYAEAEAKLEKEGFEVKKGEPRFSDQYPAGKVMMQLPYGGSQTKQGRRIYLTLSRGSEVTPMLDLVGMPLREARIALMRQGFDIGETTYDYNDTIMRDLIYAQSIPPKVGARPGTVIDVMISRGPSTRFTMMPNLIALDVETARVRVENAGLVLGIVRYKEDETYIPNTVIEQAVAPYAQVAEGAAIDITIARAPGTAAENAPPTDQPPTPDNIAPSTTPMVRNLTTSPSIAKPPAPKPITPKPTASRQPTVKPLTTKPSTTKKPTAKTTDVKSNTKKSTPPKKPSQGGTTNTPKAATPNRSSPTSPK
jgi:beta-lactam-binding protein with PASTA domain